MFARFKKRLRECIMFMRYVGSTSPIVCRCRDYTSNRFIRLAIKAMVTPYCLFRYFVGFKDYPGREGLAFVLIAKNEATYIKEWLDFHIKQGVSHFIIYDNESTDNFREVLAPYIEAGTVIYDVIRGRCRQLDAYNLALNKYRRRFKYMGFIDADEFVFVRNTTDGVGGIGSLCKFVDEFMTSHPNAGGLGINWCIFGSNHHEKRPEGGILENYTMRSLDNFFVNRHIKTICDPAKTFFVVIHDVLCYKDFCNLDENGERIDGPLTQSVHFSKIRINHYFCKSLEEYIEKRKRSRADTGETRPMSDFTGHDQNVIHDTEILSHV